MRRGKLWSSFLDGGKGFYYPTFGPVLSLYQSYAVFVIDTQGSAKPPPWAESYHAFGVPARFHIKLAFRSIRANVACSLVQISI